MDTPTDLLALARAVGAHGDPLPDETPDEARAREAAWAQAAEKLVADRLAEVRKDVAHRDAILKVENPTNPALRPCAFTEALFLADQVSTERDSKSRAVFNQIDRAVEDYAAYVIQGVPQGCTIEALAREQAGPWHPDIMAFREREAKETAKRLTKLIETDLDANHWPDLRAAVAKDAVRFGVGYFKFEDEGVLDDRDPRIAPLLEDPVSTARDPHKWALLERLRDSTVIRRADPRDVYWQAGVASAYGLNTGQEMRRVSEVQVRQTDDLRRLHPGADIRPFKAPGFPTSSSSASRGSGNSGAVNYERGKGQTTALVTTWEIVTVAETTSVEEDWVGPDGLPQPQRRSVTSWRSRMVRTVIAGDVLLSVDTWGVEDRAVALPFVAVYARCPESHPYGDRIAIRLKLSQDLINQIRLLIFEHGFKALSNQGGLIDGRKLGPGDDHEAIVKALREGEFKVIEGNDDGEDGPLAGQPHAFERVFLSTASAGAGAGVGPALWELLRMEMDNFRSMSGRTDDQALLRARGALAKNEQQKISDRVKTPVLSLLARAVEAVYLGVAANWRRVTEKDIGIPVRGGGHVHVNEPVTERVPRLDAHGKPIANPFYRPDLVPFLAELGLPPEMAEPALMTEVSGLFGDTRAPVSANADSRTWVSADPAMRMQEMMMLAEAGMILLDTARQEALPEGMRATDDENRRKAAEAEAAAQADAMRQQGVEQLATAEPGSDDWTRGAGQTLASALYRADPEIATLPPEAVQARLAALPMN